MTAPATPRQLEELGRSLREIRADYLREENGESVRWYQGRAGTDLFAWLDTSARVTRVQLTFSRSVVEWEPGAGLRTGRMDASFGGGPGRFDTYLIRPDDSAQLGILRAARDLLRVSQVDRGLAAPLLAELDRVLGAEGQVAGAK